MYISDFSHFKIKNCCFVTYVRNTLVHLNWTKPKPWFLQKPNRNWRKTFHTPLANAKHTMCNKAMHTTHSADAAICCRTVVLCVCLYSQLPGVTLDYCKLHLQSLTPFLLSSGFASHILTYDMTTTSTSWILCPKITQFSLNLKQSIKAMGTETDGLQCLITQHVNHRNKLTSVLDHTTCELQTLGQNCTHGTDVQEINKRLHQTTVNHKLSHTNIWRTYKPVSNDALDNSFSCYIISTVNQNKLATLLWHLSGKQWFSHQRHSTNWWKFT